MLNNTDNATQSDLLVAICQAASGPDSPAASSAPCAGDELLMLLSQAADDQEKAEAEAEAEAAEAAAKQLEESLEQAVAVEPELSEWAKFIQAKASAPIVAMEGPAPAYLNGKSPRGQVTPRGPRAKTPTKRAKTPEKRNKAPTNKSKLKKMSLAEMQKRSMKVRQISWVNESQWDMGKDYTPVSA